MGGGVSWRYAIENPKRVKGLVLLSSSGIPGERASRENQAVGPQIHL